MMPIYITLTQYHAGQSVPRTLDANTITRLEACLVESTLWGARIEVIGQDAMIIRETPEHIRALVAQAAHYA